MGSDICTKNNNITRLVPGFFKYNQLYNDSSKIYDNNYENKYQYIKM